MSDAVNQVPTGPREKKPDAYYRDKPHRWMPSAMWPNTAHLCFWCGLKKDAEVHRV